MKDADAGARRADHLGECFSTDLCDHSLGMLSFTKFARSREDVGASLFSLPLKK
jgi:hypothetical protein